MGCGRVGSTLARSLEDRNHDVSVIDSNPDAFRRLPGNIQHRRCPLGKEPFRRIHIPMLAQHRVDEAAQRDAPLAPVATT